MIYNQTSNPNQIWQKGKKLEEGYIIEKKIGKGGFGITYLAKDKQGKKVVIKTIHQNMSDHTYFRHDFDKEAFRLAKLDSHPHIVTIIDIINENGTKGIVMEYVQGKSLSDLVNKKNLSLIAIIRYIRQIGSALTFMHQKGWMHRDIHLKNILVKNSQSNSEAILIDFGLARPINNLEPKTPIGCPGFAPIEQMKGSRKQGAYTDVYGLAATLYTLLTKQTPVDAKTRFSTITKEKKPDPLKPPQSYCPKISDKLNDAIIKGLELESQNRPQTMQEWLKLIPQSEKELTKNNNNSAQEDSQTSIFTKIISALGFTVIIKSNKINPNSQNKTIPAHNSNNYPKTKKISQIPLQFLVIPASILLLVFVVINPFNLGDKTTEINTEKIITYTNQEYGFKIENTQNWQITAEKVGFILSIKLTPQDSLNKLENLPAIYIEKFSSPKTAAEIIKDIKLQNIQTEETSLIEINSQTAEQITYTGKKGNDIYKHKAFVIVDKNETYLITYESLKDNFTTYLSQAEDIVNSFRLL